MYGYEDFYYEPSEFEQQLDEFKESLYKAVKEEHLQEIKKLRNENARLSKIERTMEEKTTQLNSELRIMESKKGNLKSEVEREFYAKNIEDIIARFIEQSIVWFAESVPHDRKRCDLCNADRELTATYPDGTIVTKKCDCANKIYMYEPIRSTLSLINFSKKDSRYQSDRRYSLSEIYQPDKSSRYYYDDYAKFEIQHIVEEFQEKTKKLHNDLGYGEKIGFTMLEECQKYCDWLNNKQEAK